MNAKELKDRYVNPYTDFGFKKLFGTEMNKDLLISFLNSLLDSEDEIVNLSYLNNEHLGSGEADRKAVLMCIARMNGERRFWWKCSGGNNSFSKTEVSTTLHSPSANRDRKVNGTMS